MNRSNKVRIYTVILILFMFQPVIERHISPFKYFDEVVVMTSLLAYFTKKKLKLDKQDLKILLPFSILCIIGIIGNIVSKSGQSWRPIVQDIISNGKMILFALSVRNIHLSDKQKMRLEDIIALLVRVLFIIMFTTSIASQFINIGMTAKSRFGIKSFQFIFNNPAGLNTYCYLFMILHSITIMRNGKIRRYSNIFTIIGIIPWMLTMRSRAIAFAVIYLALYVYILYLRKPGSVYKFKWYQVLIVGIVAVLLSWDAIDTYFISNDRVARYNLLRNSFRIAKDCFPVGSGFGTYGTEASRVFYSSIYNRYGMANIWGLSSEHTKFITDQFWFGILGQFGYIGTIVMIVLIYRTYKNIWGIAKWEKKSQLACMILFVTSIFASFTAGTFIQASILPSVMIFYLLCDRNDGKGKIQHRA